VGDLDGAIRLRSEEIEALTLSPFAQRSADAVRGRDEAPCPIRTAYQRDRDRIIHCKAFRRLKHKTQVFISPEGDHYRTRLTHTLEVAQIARTIARGLRLNEDLTEAVALGHDLGHTPFGHAGEASLDEVVKKCGVAAGFHHNLQSVRVVDELEGEGGLNLTTAVREGIKYHSPGYEQPATAEGRVVRLADRIAYINHDIDDSLRAGILRLAELPPECLDVLGAAHRRRIDTMVRDVISASGGRAEVAMSGDVGNATEKLHDFLFERVYDIESPAKREERKARRLLEELFRFYLDNPGEVPGAPPLEGERPGPALLQAIVDYVAGMTDRFAIAQYQRHFIPAPWSVDDPGGVAGEAGFGARAAKE
jgi:dGTPase